MSLYDAMFEFSDDQDITATAVGDKYIDFQSSDLEMGAGTPLYLNIKVGDTDFDSGADDGTLAISLVYEGTDPVDTSSTAYYTLATWAEASMTAGTTLLSMALPVDFDRERYVGLLYTVAGSGDFTAGNIDAWIGNSSISSSFDTQVDESNI